MLFSLSEQAAFSIRAGYIHSPTYKIPQERLKNKQSPQPSYKQKPTPSYKQSPQPFYKQSPQPSYKQKPTTFLQTKSTTFLQAKAHSHTTSLMLKKHSENKQIQQNIPNILPFNIFLKSVLKKNRLSRLFDLEISIFYCNFATNLLTH